MTLTTSKITLHPDANDRATERPLADLRRGCVGLPPLHAKMESWMVTLCESGEVHELVDQYASPLNVISCEPMSRNIRDLTSVAEDRGVDFQVYFARKANKCLSFVDTATSTGAGIDVASLAELEQVISRDVANSDIICTAAVKDEHLMQACISHGITIAVDNEDELRLLATIAMSSATQASIAIRLSGFHHGNQPLHSRFGFDVDQLADLLRDRRQELTLPNVRIDGLHFHLDGYSAAERVSAIAECLPIVDRIRSLGHPVAFLDIGGGIPMTYLESYSQWSAFWDRHRAAVLEESDPITYRNHGLGLAGVDGKIVGKANCYPYHQSPVRGEWFAGILDSPCGETTVAESISGLHLQLRCEPGRSILDGCGMTIAKVVFRKQHRNGDWFIGLSMNRTQCRTSSDDFLVDPLLVPISGESSEPIEGFLVGAYCMESELLSLRKLRFTNGVRVGDLVVFPNTAGYLMHFLESRSHQFPLAKNVVYGDDLAAPVSLDDIDRT